MVLCGSPLWKEKVHKIEAERKRALEMWSVELVDKCWVLIITMTDLVILTPLQKW